MDEILSLDRIDGEYLRWFTREAPSLLQAAGKQIRAHPANWDQAFWVRAAAEAGDRVTLDTIHECGTTACTAGWIALELGYTYNTPSGTMTSPNGFICEHTATPALDAVFIPGGEGTPAREWLFGGVSGYRAYTPDDVVSWTADEWADGLDRLAARILAHQIGVLS